MVFHYDVLARISPDTVLVTHRGYRLRDAQYQYRTDYETQHGRHIIGGTIIGGEPEDQWGEPCSGDDVQLIDWGGDRVGLPVGWSLGPTNRAGAMNVNRNGEPVGWVSGGTPTVIGILTPATGPHRRLTTSAFDLQNALNLLITEVVHPV